MTVYLRRHWRLVCLIDLIGRRNSARQRRSRCGSSKRRSRSSDSCWWSNWKAWCRGIGRRQWHRTCGRERGLSNSWGDCIGQLRKTRIQSCLKCYLFFVWKLFLSTCAASSSACCCLAGVSSEIVSSAVWSCWWLWLWWLLLWIEWSPIFAAGVAERWRILLIL